MGHRLKGTWWQRWWSYLTDVRLEETSSEYHSILAVNLVKGRHQLCSEKTIYSYDDKYDNFRLAFEQLDFEKYQWKSVLVLGLGLASVPYLLEKTFGQHMEYTAVELDTVVAELAQDYTLSDLVSPVEVIIADAYHYLRLCNDKYDMIVMDVFAEDVIPQKFQTPNFFRRLQECLADDGILLYNRLAMTDDDHTANSLFIDPFLEVFPRGNYLEVKQNWIVLNDTKFLD